MLLFKVYPSTQSTLNQVRGIQETNCLTEHASPNLDLPSTLPTISPLLTHCSKTSSDCDTCKKEVRTAIAHCRAKAEAKRRDTAGDSATSRDREVHYGTGLDTRNVQNGEDPPSHPGRGRSCTRNPTDSNSHPGRRINGTKRRSSSLFTSSGPLTRCMRHEEEAH